MTEPHRPKRNLFTPAAGELPIRQTIAIAERLGGICGVTGVWSGLRRNMQDGASLHISFRGWSPTLHAIGVNLETAYDPGDDEDAALEAILAPLEESQRRRQRRGCHLGLSEPLVDILDEGAEPRAETRHIMIDRDLLSISAAGPDWSIERQLRETMPGMNGDTAYEGGDAYDHYGTWVADMPAGPVAGAMYMMDEHDERIGFDGRTVRLVGIDLAETAIRLLAGRRVGDVALVHDMLDQRIIVEASAEEHVGETCLDLRVETIPVPLHPESWEPMVCDAMESGKGAHTPETTGSK